MNNDQPRPLGEQPPTQEPVIPPAYHSNLQQVSEKPFSSSPEPVFVPKKSGRKKGLIIGGIIAAVLVVLGAGSAFAYQFWYQNPEKVVTDAIMNAITAKTITYTGSVDAKTDSGEIKLEIDGASGNAQGNLNVKATVDFEGTPVTLTGSGLMDDKGTLYFKLKNVKGLVESFRATLPAESQSMFDQFIAKIDDRWIKVSSDDMKDFSEEYSRSQKCFTDTIEKVKNDEAMSNEIANVYKKNKFLTITQDLGSKDGSMGYSVKTNADAGKGFVKELKNTKVYASLKDCDSSFSIDENDIKTDNKAADETKIEVWVSQWTHQITKVILHDETGPDTGNILFVPTFNKPVSVTAPKDAVTLDELKTEIESLAQSFYAGTLSEQPESMDL